MNKKKSYVLVDVETGKIIKENGKDQYFRLFGTAILKKSRLQKKLKQKIKIKSLKPVLILKK